MTEWWQGFVWGVGWAILPALTFLAYELWNAPTYRDYDGTKD